MAIERAEKQGLAVAAIGHVALFVLLSLGLFSARIPRPPIADTMDVTIADQVGMRSAATEASSAAPKASQAPERGRPEDSAPPPPPPAPEPDPTPPPPEPKPAPPPPRPAPPKPVPPKPRPVPPKPEPPKPEPKPEKPKPEPKPEKPRPEKPTPPKPVPPRPAKPAKPAPDRAAEKPAPISSKAPPSKAPPSKAAPTKAAAPARKAPGLSSDLLRDLKNPGQGKGGQGKSDARPKGSRLGADFLKGIGSDARGTSDKPRAAAVSARSMAGLAALIAAQVKPCYSPPSGGADATAIVTTLRLRFARDGSVANPPSVVEQSGGNPTYGRQMADAAKRAVLRCAPLKLPPELYEGGWEDIEFVFRPEAMG